ncbi:MAG: helix-turn-helix domain-containing protein [Chitinophagales bacterium]|nr:helix-turn-helix domain-containing protein [Chitinophagales bacterium]
MLQIGNKIKKIREFKGITREYMAAHLDVSLSHYGRIERDETPLTLDKLQQVSEALDVNYLDILSFDEKQVFNFINHGNHSSQAYVLSQEYNYPPHIIENLIQRISELEKSISELKR